MNTLEADGKVAWEKLLKNGSTHDRARITHKEFEAALAFLAESSKTVAWKIVKGHAEKLLSSDEDSYAEKPLARGKRPLIDGSSSEDSDHEPTVTALAAKPLKLVKDDVDLEGCEEDDASGCPFKALEEYEHWTALRAKLTQFKESRDAEGYIRSSSAQDASGSRLGFAGHFVFTGSPGTGKTTAAGFMAKILHKLGLIRRPHFHEVRALDLVGQYLGHTAPKVHAALEKARHGVLFVDEAHNLVEQGHHEVGNTKSFAKEALATLVGVMEHPREETPGGRVVVIFAGYTAQMERMLEQDPGLRSRIGDNVIWFKDWSPEDCTRLFLQLAAKDFWELSQTGASTGDVLGGRESCAPLSSDPTGRSGGPSGEPVAHDKIRKGFEQVLVDGFKKLAALPGFGNARDVIRVWGRVRMGAIIRLRAEEATAHSKPVGGVRQPPTKDASQDARKMLLIADVEKVFDSFNEARGGVAGWKGCDMGIAEVKEALAPLNRMSAQIQRLTPKLEKLFVDHSREKSAPNFVIMGPPGTGKTKVADALGGILFELQIISRSKVHTKTGQELTDPFRYFVISSRNVSRAWFRSCSWWFARRNVLRLALSEMTLRRSVFLEAPTPS